jgi:hypothetical protein
MELDGMCSQAFTDPGNRHPYHEPIAGGGLRIGPRAACHPVEQRGVDLSVRTADGLVGSGRWRVAWRYVI